MKDGKEWVIFSKQVGYDAELLFNIGRNIKHNVGEWV